MATFFAPDNEVPRQSKGSPFVFAFFSGSYLKEGFCP
jgi:hypothetical protein